MGFFTPKKIIPPPQPFTFCLTNKAFLSKIVTEKGTFVVLTYEKGLIIRYTTHAIHVGMRKMQVVQIRTGRQCTRII